MTREELIKRIADGAAYLQREDILPREREVAQQRYDRMRHELRQLDKAVDPKAVKGIAAIREILKRPSTARADSVDTK